MSKMTTQLTQLENGTTQVNKTFDVSISDIFLNYLQEIMDEETLKKYYHEGEFKSISQFLPEFGITAFPALVDLSLKYLSKSLQSILSSFNLYYQNYRFEIH